MGIGCGKSGSALVGDELEGSPEYGLLAWEGYCAALYGGNSSLLRWTRGNRMGIEDVQEGALTLFVD